MSKASKMAPGKSYRKGISLMEVVKTLDTEEKLNNGLSSRDGRTVLFARTVKVITLP